jgi:hypothetical protein
VSGPGDGIASSGVDADVQQLWIHDTGAASVIADATSIVGGWWAGASKCCREGTG